MRRGGRREGLAALALAVAVASFAWLSWLVSHQIPYNVTFQSVCLVDALAAHCRPNLGLA